MKSPEQFGRKEPRGENALETLRNHKDETVRAIVENIDAVRQAQSIGEGIVDDRERMRQLEKNLNGRLRELNEPEVSLG